jgi:hypothetical protein
VAGAVREKLLEAAGEYLGEEALVRLQEALESPLQGSDFALGAMRRDISIRIDELENGEKQYRIRETSGTPGAGSGGGSFSMSGSAGGGTGSATPSVSMVSRSGGKAMSFSRTSTTKELPEAYRHFLPDL